MPVKTTHDTVAEVYEKLKAEGSKEPAAVEDPVVGAEAAAAAGDAAEPADPVAPEPAKTERQRGPDGKFAKPDAKPPPADAVPAGTVDPKLVAAPLKPATPALPELKPPADWSPRAKEKWAHVPREAQEEAIRLHTEVKKVLQDSAQARQAADAYQRTVAPYEHMFRAAGKSPVEGVGWLVQQYAALQTAPIPQRVAIAAGLIRDFIGVDEASIRLLADQLEGKPGAQPTAPAPLRPEQIQQMVRDEAARMQGEGQRQAELKAIQDFEASGAEFLPNLTKEITAIVTLEKQQGKPITAELMKSAYERALRINPETGAILKQRDDAASAAKAKEEAAKKAAAASGIKTEPTGPADAGVKPRTTREEVEFQMQKARGQRRA